MMRNLARETADSEMAALLFRLAAAYDDAATRAEHVPNAYFERAASAAT